MNSSRLVKVGGQKGLTLASAGYSRRIPLIQPSFLVGYWPFNEVSGLIADEATSATGNAISNGGFETAGGGGADVWAGWTESAGDGAIADEGTLVHSGSHAAKLTAGATRNTVISQLLNVLPGQQGTFAFWTRGDGTYAGRYRIYDNTNGAEIRSTITTGITGTTYTRVTYSFTVPAGCLQLIVYLWCPSTNTGIAYFDDVSLTTTLEGRYLAGGGGVITLGGDSWRGRPAVVLNGVDTCIEIGGSAFNQRWNGDLFSMVGVGQVDSAARWLDLTTMRYLHHERSTNDDTYYAVMGKGQSNHMLEWRRRSGGAPVVVQYTFAGTGPLDKFVMGMTFDQSIPQLDCYLWSLPTGFLKVGTSNDVALTAWGNHPLTDPVKCLFGAGSSTLQEWIGTLADHALWCGVKLTDAEMQSAMTP